MNNQLIPFNQARAIELFQNPKDMQSVLNEIEKQAKDFDPDPTTEAGRKKIGSQAAMVSSSKVVIEKAKKTLTADWAKKKKDVDSLGKIAVDFCDRVRDEILEARRKWQAEEEKVAEEAALKAKIAADEIEAYHANDLFDREAKVLAAEAKMEAERAEKERVEAARIAEEEQKGRNEQIRKDAEERAKREAAEELEQEREKLAQAEQRGKEQAERAEREKQEAADRAEQDRLDAIENERIRVARLAAQKQAEQDRLDEIERVKSENVKHQKAVNNTILAALVKGGVDEKAAKVVITLVAQNKVPSMLIKY